MREVVCMLYEDGVLKGLFIVFNFGMIKFFKSRFVLFFVVMKWEKKDNGLMFIFIWCNIIILG